MPARALDGKVAVVTGAGRGIGRAIALGYAEAGAAVCCISRTRAEVADTGQAIVAAGGLALVSAIDVADEIAVQSAIDEAASQFGGVDIVLLSHGVALSVGLLEVSVAADWKRTVEVNLFGSYNCIKSAIPHLRRRGSGKIIIVGSGQGHNGTAAASAYASSKAGVWGLAQSLAAELVSDDITVNELLPGNVHTRLYKETFARTAAAAPEGIESISGKRAHEWLKSPEDVVPLALFLATQPRYGPTAQVFSLMRRF